MSESPVAHIVVNGFTLPEAASVALHVALVEFRTELKARLGPFGCRDARDRNLAALHLEQVDAILEVIRTGSSAFQ